MHILDPDLMDLARQLSPAVNLVVAVVGVLLWLFGAYSHRFWLAATITVTAGVTGLHVGRDFGVQPLVAALLLALSAGVLSLSLARIALFLTGGLAALLLLRAAGLSWNEFVCFLAGGLAGVCLYRWWIMVVSSLVGTVLASYAFLSLLDSLGQMDAPTWVQRHGPLLSWGIVGGLILGVVIQFALDRLRRNPEAPARGKKKNREAPPQPPPPPAPPPPPKSPWWQLGGLLGRRAA